VGIDFIQKKEIYYKDVLKKVRNILEHKKNEDELILCTLSFMSNLSFYEREGILI